MKQLKRVAIVVGEESGDILGAGLILALKKRFPDCVFEGVGGPRMLALGFQSHHSMERLAVMGLVEPLKRLPELLSIRSSLKQRYIDSPPDVFIGIDAPDFNLTLELNLRKAGVRTVHYVSPSVWAWRQGRVKKIAKAVDLMLTLFPFEERFYIDNNVAVKCVGHPLADEIPVEDVKEQSREKLGIPSSDMVIALLPGSRKSEVEKLGHVLLEAALQIKARYSDVKFLIPAANDHRKSQLEQLIQGFSGLDITLYDGQSHDVMAAADYVVMASGTTTLEALLLKRPMTITYKMAALSYYILSKLVKSKYIGLPNLLADHQLVPELIQHDATPERIAGEVIRFLEDPSSQQQLHEQYKKIHLSIRKDASEAAAGAIADMVLN